MNIQKLISWTNEFLADTGYTVTLYETDKNGVHYKGMKVHVDDVRVTPIVYINENTEDCEETQAEMYAKYIEDLMKRDEDTEKLIVDFQNMSEEEFFSKIWITIEDMKNLSYYDADNNITFLNYDLEVIEVARFIVDEDEKGISSTKLTRNLTTQLPFYASDSLIRQKGYENLKKRSQILPMGKFLFDEFDVPFPEISTGFYIVTNKNLVNGASTILSKHVRNELYDLLGDELYILPSSIHETIVMRNQGNDEDIDILRKMVYEINKEVVSDSDKLKDAIWCAKRINNTCDIIATMNC